MPSLELCPPTGVQIDDFTDEIWTGVATAYFRSALQVPEDEEIDPARWFYTNAEAVKNGWGEYRFGSLITPHSKLTVCNITRSPLTYHFDFHANADPRELEFAASRGITPESIQNDFRTQTGLFLAGAGVAQEVECCT